MAGGSRFCRQERGWTLGLGTARGRLTASARGRTRGGASPPWRLLSRRRLGGARLWVPPVPRQRGLGLLASASSLPQLRRFLPSPPSSPTTPPPLRASCVVARWISSWEGRSRFYILYIFVLQIGTQEIKRNCKLKCKSGK